MISTSRCAMLRAKRSVLARSIAQRDVEIIHVFERSTHGFSICRHRHRWVDLHRSPSPPAASAAPGVNDAIEQNLRRILARYARKIPRGRVARCAMLVEVRFSPRGVTCIDVLDRIRVAVDGRLLLRPQKGGDIFYLRL